MWIKQRLMLATLGAPLLACGLVLFPSSLQGAMAQSPAIWLSIDTGDLSLRVMQDETPLLVYDNIAIGSNGPTWEKQVEDEKTPLGDFRITEIRESRRFSIFMAIDYPNLDHTRRAYAEQRIDAAEYRALQDALQQGRAPPQNTELGGHLGIHGLGKGSVEIHESFNWTDGCIALTNEQVQELMDFVRVGTRVRIR